MALVVRGPSLHLTAAVVLSIAAACAGDGTIPRDPAGTGGAGAASSSTTGGADGGGSPATGPSTSAGVGGGLPASFVVRGVVTDGSSAPVAGASVLQGGGEVQALTGEDGSFEIAIATSLPGRPTLVAAKIGYRAAGEELFDVPDGPIELVLRAAEPPDDEGYAWGEPGTGDPSHDVSTAYCGHCHTTFVATFQGSAHQRATRDPWVQDLYAGVATARLDDGSCEAVGGARRPGKVPGTADGRADRCYVGDGVLPDLNGCGAPGEPSCDDPALGPGERPAAFGACADCHSAGMDGPAGGRDLLDATGVGFEQGNHCDACHKVREVTLEAPPGTAGRLALQRPRERVTDAPGAAIRQVMYGPLLDVPNGAMGGSFQPDFLEATLCAGCHEQRQGALLPGAELDPSRWPDGLPTHSTFTEWSESPFAAAGAPCQSCHMPPIPGMFNSVDVAVPETAGLSSGFGRPPERNRSHAFLGALEGPQRMIDVALAMTLEAAPAAAPSAIDVDVTLANVGAGHAVPTGEPLRSLLLVVDVEACGQRAVATDGASIGDTGGALAEGVVGGDADGAPTLGGAWPAAATLATAGQRLRVTRPTGEHLDYPGIGRFADPALTPEDKGIPVRVPVADALVVGVEGDVIVTEPPLDLLDGDVLWLGEAPDLREGAPVRALAGLPGQDFARITVDPSGRRHVPHHRAVDLASDHRVPPGGQVTSRHGFALAQGCSEATVTATVLYRRAPLALARERGWQAVEHVVASATRVVALP
jgi:hypothetical protein